MSAIAPVTLTPESVEAIAERVAELLIGHGRSQSLELIDAAEVARRLGITRGAVYERAGELGAVRLGTGPRPRLRFEAERVAEALVACERPNPSTTPAKREAPRQRRRRATDVELLPIRGSEQ